MPIYIHELKAWPRFRWDEAAIVAPLAETRHRQGRLVGRMQALGFPLREEAVLHALTEDVLKSSEIEGDMLDKAQVRSSIARRLGLEIGGSSPADRHVEGVVEMMLDATQNYAAPLSADRLFGWQAALFPAGRSGLRRITVGAWRRDERGPMEVVSGAVGRERVHYQAPPARRLAREMRAFLRWFNRKDAALDPVLKAAIAHFWFVTVHPFDDGNGRVARAIADMSLARSEGSPQRFYSMSTQIRTERSRYYAILEATQRGDLDISEWLDWFLACLQRAFAGAEQVLATVLRKADFWRKHATTRLNARQRDMLNRLLDGFAGKLTSTKWAKIEKCSADTALRDITDLVDRRILRKDPAGGRSTSYSLADVAA